VTVEKAYSRSQPPYVSKTVGILKALHSKIDLTARTSIFILVLVFFPACVSTRAESGVTFTSADRFNIPALNGSINFWLNGSCSAATLENGTWIFTDLRLNDSEPLGTLKISAANCNVTVYYYRTYNLIGHTVFIQYAAEGQGTQAVNLGLNNSQPTDPGEWSVIVPDNVFLAEGKEWTLLPDNTVVVWGVTGNVSIAHFGYDIPTNEGPFSAQHSIAIITAAVVAVTIVVAVVIKVRART
jgi:hypothetical protein